MNTLLETVRNTVCNYKLFEKNDIVLVALSGGADSVALLRCMLELQDELGLTAVLAVHVNHGIRGENATRDECFVRELCKSLSVPLTVAHMDVPGVIAQTGESTEEAARRLRYEFLQNQSRRYSHAKIATAHTADDHVESILLHLIRGCGLTGVVGIPVSRENIVRPLLECSSDDVRLFCRSRGYAFVVDETNDDVRYSRNRVRHEILPSMRHINPSVNDALMRFSHIAAEEDRFLSELALNVIRASRVDENSYSVHILMQADPVLRKRAIYGMCCAEHTHILGILECLENGGTVNLPGDISAVSDGKILRFIRRTRRLIQQSTDQFEVRTDISICFYGVNYIPRVLSHEEYREKSKIHKNLLNYCISYDKIDKDVVLRSRRTGDRIRPFGRGCSKSLKKLMNEERIPQERRQYFPVLAKDDHVLLVIGLCVDESVAVTSSTERILWFDVT